MSSMMDKSNTCRLIALEPEPAGREALKEALSEFSEGVVVSSKHEFLSHIKAVQYDAILLCLHVEKEEETLDYIRRGQAIMPFTPLIVLSDCEDVQTVVRAMKSGATEFVVKPFSSVRIQLAVEKALENKSLLHERDYLRHEQDVIYDLERIIAFTPVMRKVMDNLRKYSLAEGTVLMQGETGTGKSMLAGALHFNSPRRAKPFVHINCANIQENLLESELFGHERGAFTGADRLRIGRFEQAAGGTVFLDEIGEMSHSLQAKLLRVLEEKTFERVGGNQTIRADVRVIAATNRDLEELVAQRKFREDLFYRVSVLPVWLPPLRERQQCLEPLSYHLLWKIARSLRKRVQAFSPEVLETIHTFSWPGNIRQLANTIERAVILEESELVMPENFILPSPARRNAALIEAPALSPEVVLPEGRRKAAFEISSSDHERERIRLALDQCLWIQKDAARMLGMSPRMLNHWIKKLGITHPRWRRNA